MATAIKMTKQKSPEACYDKLIQIAEQIHSYIDFQEDKFNGNKKQQLDYLNNTQSHLWKNKHTTPTTAAIEHSDHPCNVNTGVSCKSGSVIDKVILYS